MVDLLMKTNPDLKKREMLINFVISQIDDKNLRLDLKRPNINFLFEDVKTLAGKAVKIMRNHCESKEMNVDLVVQDM